jgi:hypothetical protein
MLGGKVVNEITDILERGSVKLSGYHQFGCCGFVSRFLTLARAFYFGFTVACFVVVICLCLGFLDLAVFLLAVTLRCLGVSCIG